MSNNKKNEIRKIVRERYALVAKVKDKVCCSGSTCCSPNKKFSSKSIELGYTKKDLKSVPKDANLGLGCGNPQAIACLKNGEKVIDLGGGGGFDCFLAAKKVGAKGKVIGVDMTPEMVALARQNAEKSKCKNVDFRLGEIEHLPVADDFADVIISNCVINLSPFKEQVYKEAYRVLKKGGRLAVSDIVVVKSIPKSICNNLNNFAGCVAGAISKEKLNKILKNAGFKNININIKEDSKEYIKEWFPGMHMEKYVRSADITGFK